MALMKMNKFAVILSPIIEAGGGQIIRNRIEKRRDKMNFFQSLALSSIFGWMLESVNILNLLRT